MMKLFFKTTAYGALFFVLFLISVPGFNHAAAAEDELQKAERLSNEMQYEEAIQVLNNFIQANAADAGQKTRVANAYYLSARIYFDVDSKDPQVKQNLTKTFEYDKNFNTKEINAAFKKLAEEVRGKPQPTPTIAPKKIKTSLKVEIGAGAGGSPEDGHHSYTKGKVVRYNYKAAKGTAKLTVTLDGETVPAKGTVTMNENRRLTVTAVQQAGVVVNSNPAGAAVYVDGMDSGKLTNHTFSFPAAGAHEFLLRKVGYKDFVTTINADFDNPKTLSQELEKGLNEDFNVGADSSILWHWQTNPAAKWEISNGNYVSTAKCGNWNYSIYNHNFAASSYTLRIKMKRIAGEDSVSNGIALITGANPTALRGYLFCYMAKGMVSFWKMTDYNINTASGRITTLGKWGKTTVVKKGLGSDNSIKIQKDGNTYTYYMNNIKLYSFTDTAYNPGYIMIGGDCAAQNTQLSFDYVYLDASK